MSDGVAIFVFNLESLVLFVSWWVLLGVKVFAVLDALIRKDAFYVAAEKQNKAFWLLLLIVFLALHLILPSVLNPLNLIGTVAALVYLADVRPVLRTMHHR
ncbi:MAG TPA: DUF2516 family protein [Nocardioidaceae bacterium]|nr:DUF2516 family protein [Nocardioidaceae bacterium]